MTGSSSVQLNGEVTAALKVNKICPLFTLKILLHPQLQHPNLSDTGNRTEPEDIPITFGMSSTTRDF